MQEHKISPEKITKPIQLLAAWLIGLLLLVSTLLAASGTVKEPDWLPAFFGISAVAIIPVFLVLIFLLQTKYRPEMQEDSYYSKYLNQKTAKTKNITAVNALNNVLPIKMQFGNLGQEVMKMSKDFKGIRNIIEKPNKFKGTTDAFSGNKIEFLLAKTDQRLGELKQNIELEKFNLWLNTKIHKYLEILSVIREMGFTSIHEFGNKPIPAYFAVAFGRDVPFELAKNMILKLIPLGAGIVQEVEEEIEWSCNDIYIGSYATNINPVIIDEHFIDKLNVVNEEINFSEFLKKVKRVI